MSTLRDKPGAAYSIKDLRKYATPDRNVGAKKIVESWVKANIPEEDLSNYQRVFCNPSGFGIDVPAEYLDDFLHEAVDVFSSVNVGAKTYSMSNRPAKTNRFNFEQHIVKTTMEWDGGCDSGKMEFLAAIFGGKDKIPELPKKRIRVVIEMDADKRDLALEEDAYDSKKKPFIVRALENNWHARFPMDTIKLVEVNEV